MAGSSTTPAASGPSQDERRLGYEAFANSPDLVIVLDDDRRIRAINPAAESLTGVARDEIVGRHVSAILAPDAVDHGLADIERAAAGQVRDIDVGFLSRWADGTDEPGRVTVGLGVAPLFVDGEVAGLVLSGRDVEDRKRLEHELEELASSFQALAEASEIGIYRFGFDPGFRVEHVNRSFADALGYEADELRSRSSILNDQLAPHVREQFVDNRFGPGPPIWPIEFDWTRPDGEVVVLSVEEVPVRDRDGRLIAVLGLTRDVTQERRREAAIVRALQHERQAAEALRHVDQLRRLFLQAVSHELRTPLTTVLGFAATLSARADELATDRVAHLSGRLLRQAQRIERLLDDLLDVERLSRGVLTLHRQDHDLAAVVTETLHEMEEPGVEVSASPTIVAIDRGKIERVVVNLVTNARRHAGPDARIRVSVAPSGDGARLTVEDDGPGIPDDLKDEVFEPFSQGPATKEYPSPGTGIGLTLVAEFVRLHGGSVRIEDARGGGATFVVELPGAPQP